MRVDKVKAQKKKPPAKKPVRKDNTRQQKKPSNNNNNNNNYTFPVRRLGVHLGHLLDNVCPFLLVLAQSPPIDEHTLCAMQLR